MDVRNLLKNSMRYLVFSFLFLSLSVLLSLPSVVFAEAKKTLTFVLPSNLEMPYVEYNKTGETTTAVDGFLYDWYLAIAHEMNYEAKLLVLPRIRMNAEVSGHLFDLRCYFNKKWGQKEIPYYDWSSKPYMTAFNVVVFRNELTAPKGLNDLKGELGVILGYQYPSLQKIFDKKQVIRMDFPKETAILQRVANGQLKYGVIDHRTVLYYLSRNPEWRAHVKISKFSLDENPVLCARTKTSPVKEKDLDRAILRLKKRGVLSKILARYQ